MTGSKTEKHSVAARIALAGVALLGVGLFLVVLFWHFSREEQVLNNRTQAGEQILQGIIETNPAFLLVFRTEGSAPISPVLISGWSAQIRSVLATLPHLPFPWSSSDLRMIARLDRTFGRFFRETALFPEKSSQKSLMATVLNIVSIRQGLVQSVETTNRRLERKSLEIQRTLSLLEAGIFGTGLFAFGLFSFFVLQFRSTKNLLKKIADSESYLNTMIEAVPAALFLKDAAGRWLKVNRAGLALFDLSGKPWQNRTDLELSREYPRYREVLETCRVRDLAAWERGKPTVAIESVSREDGTVRQLETTKIPVRNLDGSPLGLVVSAYDLTERIRDEGILSRYYRLFEIAEEGIVITGEDRKIVDVNPAYSLITGYSRDEVLGSDPRILHSGQQTEEFYRSMWKAIDTCGSWKGEIWNRRKSGEIYCEYLEMNVLLQDGHVTHYIGVFSDITKRKEDDERLVHMAFHDALTGLPSRRFFIERIEEAVARLGRNLQLRFAVGILDLAGFKEVNDRLGHSAGDDILAQVSRRLQDIFRETDILARLGGDEFGLLVSEIEDEEAFFARIMKTLSDPFEVEGEWVTIYGSLGVTFCPPDQGDVSHLLSHADLALYQVKNRGGGGWAPFQQKMEETIKLRHRLRFEFERALSNGELVLHYQPQVNMTTGQVVGVESLVRWNHPDQGFLLPSAFIDVVEKSELIAPLGRFVMQEALSQQTRWKQGGLALPISVNIGAHHFLSGSFHDDLESALARHDGSHPATIEIEVTETEALRDLSHAQRVIEQCHGLDIMVSLDDFGTGQASLAVLQNLSVGEIKIDQGFVRGIAESQKKQAIASGLIAIGRIMQLKVVVEGIETEEEGLFMIRMGCELAQGYSIAKPMPAEAIPEWITLWKPFESWTLKNLLGSAVNGEESPPPE
jgi:diguanylate cyclase (GGDEF)-like protein/PAS domain S-box-containing protein